MQIFTRRDVRLFAISKKKKIVVFWSTLEEKIKERKERMGLILYLISITTIYE